MNRYKFLSDKPAREAPTDITIGQVWKNKMHDSSITIISKNKNAWLVEDSYIKPNGQVASEGTKEVLESFILNFYRKL